MPRVANWSRTERCAPLRVLRPRDEDEVVALVRGARDAGVRVKAVGALHSWSAAAMTDGWLVSLDALDRVLEVEGTRVTVQAGIRLKILCEELATRGLSLSIVGSVLEQSLAGAIATGTHGSSVRHGNLASAVEGLVLVTGTGERLALDADDPRLAGARVSLGGLGIVTQVTLRVEEAFRVVETTESRLVDAVEASLPELAGSAEYLKVWWLPHTDRAVVFSTERTDEVGAVSPLGRALDEWVVNRGLFALLLMLVRFLPGLVPAVNRLVARTYLAPRRVVGPMHRVLSLAMPPRHREVEWAVPLERAGDALAATRSLIERQGARVNFIVEVRFVRGDDAWLSPAHGGDVCQIGAYMAEGPGIEEYFDGFARAMESLGGRPHWGKELRAGRDDLLRWYPRAADWLALREELDPDRLFVGRFLEPLIDG